MENRIHEHRWFLLSCRTSCATLRAKQIRLALSTVATIVMPAMHPFGLCQTELVQAQGNTIRLQLRTIGAVIQVTVRRVWVSLSESCRFREVIVEVGEKLRSLAVPLPPVSDSLS